MCCHTLSHNALSFTLSSCPVIAVITEDFCDFFYWTNVKTFEHKIGIKCCFLFQDKRTELAELNMQKLAHYSLKC